MAMQSGHPDGLFVVSELKKNLKPEQWNGQEKMAGRCDGQFDSGKSICRTRSQQLRTVTVCVCARVVTVINLL